MFVPCDTCGHPDYEHVDNLKEGEGCRHYEQLNGDWGAPRFWYCGCTTFILPGLRADQEWPK
jgi:hypothetical protein